MRCLHKSRQQFLKANKKLPLGVSSNFRYWGDDKTIYVKRGKGARLWDLDGNEYIDYRLAYGPSILGYADSRVDEAAREGMNIGGVFALSTELEYEVACRISKMVPAAVRSLPPMADSVAGRSRRRNSRRNRCRSRRRDCIASTRNCSFSRARWVR